jgi:hypothetical protein
VAIHQAGILAPGKQITGSPALADASHLSVVTLVLNLMAVLPYRLGESRGCGMSDDRMNGLQIGELPRLRIMASDEILFHEEPDAERVARLVDRLASDRVLRNPPIVAVREGRPGGLLLDGANRVTALVKLGLPHVLVQLIPYEDERLVLDCWHHSVEHLSAEQLLEHAASLDGVTVQMGGELPAPDGLCQLKFIRGDGALLRGAGTLQARVEQLRRFTNVYHHLLHMDRVSYTNMAHLGRNYRHLTALVSFPRLTKAQLAEIVDGSLRAPSGITRVILPKRALRLNLHLEVLGSGLSLAEKNGWLEETIRQKVLDKAIRFYREPTFHFDE